MLARQQSIPPGGNLSSEDILSPVKPHLDALGQFLEGQVEAFEPSVRELVRYCLQGKGKRIRSMLMFYAGWKEDGAVLPDLVKAAAVIELVHLATLVHDDILDAAHIRHNLPTVSEKHGPAVAVLLGDALFAQALKLASDFPTVEVCRAVSLSTRRVCCGELRQTFERGNAAFSVEDYFEVIRMKTAELFEVSCYLGGMLAGFPEDYCRAAALFGRHLGIAYQLYDDLADFLGDETKIGKTLGTDIASGKFTLPMLLLFQRLPEKERDSLLCDLSSHRVELKPLLQTLRSTGALEETRAAFFRELATAEAGLAPHTGYAATCRLLALSAYVRAQLERLPS